VKAPGVGGELPGRDSLPEVPVSNQKPYPIPKVPRAPRSSGEGRDQDMVSDAGPLRAQKSTPDPDPHPPRTLWPGALSGTGVSLWVPIWSSPQHGPADPRQSESDPEVFLGPSGLLEVWGAKANKPRCS
jgi:hypothetical protein